MSVKLLVTSGSARTGSLNARLAALAARLAREAGAQVTELDLAALNLPLYHGDIEAAGIPAGALELRRLFHEHAGFIVAAPEYNAFVTPLLVNSIDWTSRVPAQGDQPSGLAAMGGTVAGLLSASPGALGGQRGLIFLRSFLSMAPGMLVLPQTASIGQAHQAFDDAGMLKDAKQQQAVQRVVQAVIQLAGAGPG
jgi:chromate reductase, NAD(P)H dehydrogenase (quinone)